MNFYTLNPTKYPNSQGDVYVKIYENDDLGFTIYQDRYGNEWMLEDEEVVILNTPPTDKPYTAQLDVQEHVVFSASMLYGSPNYDDLVSIEDDIRITPHRSYNYKPTPHGYKLSYDDSESSAIWVEKLRYSGGKFYAYITEVRK